jgi:hypothetical protein
MRWSAFAWGLVVVAGCGGAPGGADHDDDGGSGSMPSTDASTGSGGDTDGGNGGGGTDASMPSPPQVLANDCTYMDFMRADATHLYWSCDPDTRIRRMPLEGGPIETMYTGTGWANGLAVDNGFVYIAQSRGSAFNYSDLVVRVPAGGGAPVTLVNPTGVGALDVDDGWVYYADAPDYVGRVMRVPVNGGTSHFVVHTHAKATAFTLIADAGSAYYIDNSAIMKVDVQSKQVSELAGNVVATDIALDDQFVYFVTCTTSQTQPGCFGTTAYRVPRGGGAIEALGAGQPAGSRISVVDDNLQWGSHVISLSGGAERTLLDTQSTFVVAATPQAFYFGDTQSGTIYRAAR